MAQRVRDVMTPEPVIVPESMPLTEVARIMRDRDIGDVLVANGVLAPACILTDRDIVVRGLTRPEPPDQIMAGEICTRDLESISPDDSVDAAVTTMREHAVRRLPVVDNGEIVGIVSMGDLAPERDMDRALAEISEAPPNR